MGKEDPEEHGGAVVVEGGGGGGGGGDFWDNYGGDDIETGIEDDKRMLLNVEQNIANLERNILQDQTMSSSSFRRHSGSRRSKDASPETPKKR